MAYPSKNTYNQYHKEIVDLIIDDNSRLVTAYFNLEPSDVATFKLSNIVVIDGQHYIVNKVRDYDTRGGRLTKVELITFKLRGAGPDFDLNEPNITNVEIE